MHSIKISRKRHFLPDEKRRFWCYKPVQSKGKWHKRKIARSAGSRQKSHWHNMGAAGKWVAEAGDCVPHKANDALLPGRHSSRLYTLLLLLLFMAGASANVPGVPHSSHPGRGDSQRKTVAAALSCHSADPCSLQPARGLGSASAAW